MSDQTPSKTAPPVRNPGEVAGRAGSGPGFQDCLAVEAHPRSQTRHRARDQMVDARKLRLGPPVTGHVPQAEATRSSALSGTPHSRLLPHPRQSANHRPNSPPPPRFAVKIELRQLLDATQPLSRVKIRRTDSRRSGESDAACGYETLHGNAPVRQRSAAISPIRRRSRLRFGCGGRARIGGYVRSSQCRIDPSNGQSPVV
jgi:hypothetical protein